MGGSRGMGMPVPSNGLKFFGAVVKIFRERAGLTQEGFAPLVRFSPQTIASIEQGRRFPPEGFVERAERTLNSFGVLKAAAKHLSRNPAPPNWTQIWADMEASALSQCTYECRVVPVLLQTEAYMRAIMRNTPPLSSEDQVERWVTAGLARQALLRREPTCTLSFIVEQAVLSRQIGAPASTESSWSTCSSASSCRT